MKGGASRSASALIAIASLAASLVAPALRADDLRTRYILGCMGCHLEDGSGAPGKVPSMRESLVPLAGFAEGRRYLVQVPGVAQSPFSDREVAELLNWMVRNLSERPAPPAFVEFTAAEVSAARQQLLTDAAGTRTRLLSVDATSRESSN